MEKLPDASHFAPLTCRPRRPGAPSIRLVAFTHSVLRA